MPEDLEEKGAEIKEAREEGSKVAVEEATESPLAEARRLKDEIKEAQKKLSEERAKFEEMMAETRISGRAEGGTRKETQEDKDQAEADRFLRAFK